MNYKKNLYLHTVILSVCTVILSGCGMAKQLPSTHTEINYIDSCVVNVRDSVVLIPIERIVDIVPQYDTLYMSTTIAESKAYVDTALHLLKGEIRNKDTYQFKERVEYTDRVIEKIDSVYVEKPIVQEKVKYKTIPLFWWSLGLNAVFILLLGAYIYTKIKKTSLI